MEISVMMTKFVSAATILAAAAGAHGAFSLATHGWGDTAGVAYTTSNGSAFYVHTTRDDGSGNPDLLRPLHAASWVAGNDVEWTTYITEGSTPSRRSGSPNNQSDMFYMANGPVYSAGFLSANAAAVSFGPGTVSAGALTGTLFGSSFITGPAVAATQSPLNGINPVTGAPYQGILLARMTVGRGVTINGRPNLIGTAGGSPFNVNLNLNSGVGAAVGGGLTLYVNAYKVAEVNIADDGFDGDGEAYGAADVYDIWLEEGTTVPTPGALALAGMAGLAGLRRRRA